MNDRARGVIVPVALLCSGLAIGAFATRQAYGAAQSHEAVVRRLIQDYGEFAAWSFAGQVSDGLRTHFHALFEPVVHTRPVDEPATATLGRWLDAMAAQADTSCGSSCTPAWVFLLQMRGGHLISAGRGVPEASELQEVRRAIVPAAARARGTRDFQVVSPVVGARRVWIVIAVPDGEAAFGFVFQPAEYGWLFRAKFSDRPLLPASLTRGRDNDAIVRAAVVDADSGLFFLTGATPPAVGASTTALSEQFGGLAVRAELRPSAKAWVTQGTAPPAPVTPLLAALVVAFGVSIAAGHQLRRTMELGRLRSDFVASVSHELRTPLAQVQLFLEMVRLGRYRDQQQLDELLSSMQREITRLTSLISNVLQFGSARQTGAAARRRPVNLADYVPEILEGYEPLARSRGVRIEHALADVYAAIEPDGIRQVILNLLDNALKYGPRGQVVSVTATEAGGKAILCVVDQGPGIPIEEQSRIWEPFYRGSNAVGTVAAGSGIGLSVVRDVVRRHGGTVKYDADYRLGSRFVVEMPGEPRE